MSIKSKTEAYFGEAIEKVFGANPDSLYRAKYYSLEAFKVDGNVLSLLEKLNLIVGGDFISIGIDRGAVIPQAVAIHISNEMVANGQAPTTLTSLIKNTTELQQTLGSEPLVDANLMGNKENPNTVTSSLNMVARVIGQTAIQAGRFASCDFDQIAANVQARVAALPCSTLQEVIQAIADGLDASGDDALKNAMELDFTMFDLSPDTIKANIANMNDYDYEQCMPSSFENYDASVVAAKIYMAGGLYNGFWEYNVGYSGPFWASSVLGVKLLMNDVNDLVKQGVDIGDIVAKITLNVQALETPSNNNVATAIAQALVDVGNDNEISVTLNADLDQALLLDLDSMYDAAGSDLKDNISDLSGSTPAQTALSLYGEMGFPTASSIASMNILSAAMTAKNLNNQVEYSTMITEMQTNVLSLTNVTFNSVVAALANAVKPIDNIGLVNIMLSDLGWWWYGYDATPLQTNIANLVGDDAPSITTSLYRDVFEIPFIASGTALALTASAITTDMLTNQLSNTTVINKIINAIEALPYDSLNYNVSVAFANAVNAGNNTALIQSVTAELDMLTVLGMPKSWIQGHIENLQGTDGPSIATSFVSGNFFWDLTLFTGFNLLTADILKPGAPADISTAICTSSVVVGSLGDFYSCSSTDDSNPMLIASGSNSITGTELANKQCNLWGYDHSRKSIFSECNHIYVSEVGAGGCFRLTPGYLQTLPVNITSVVHSHNYFPIPSMAVTYDGCLKTACTTVTEVVYSGCAASMHIPRLYVDQNTYMTSPRDITVHEAGEDRTYTIPALQVVGASSNNAGDLASFCQMMIDNQNHYNYL